MRRRWLQREHSSECTCCCKVEEAVYSVKDMKNFMTKLDSLIAANDPEKIARYVNDVASVTNSPSMQSALSKEDRQSVSNFN